jgi:hypothetical protein
MIAVGGMTGPVATTRAMRRAPVGGFAVPFQDVGHAEEAARAEGASSVMLGGMIALQEEESPAVRDRRARRHAQTMLDELARLQRGLLGGEVEAGSLARLAALTELVPAAADPALGALVQSVALRARIELARRAV